MKLRKGHRAALFLIFALLFVSGMLAWALAAFFEVEGEFGSEPNPYLHASLVWHGAAAFLWLVALGSLSEHIRSGWRGGGAWRSGLLQIVANALLSLSGFALYYASSEGLRQVARKCHLGVGMLLPLLLLLHLAFGKLWRAARPSIKSVRSRDT